jgi:Holliday junction resolvase RusA-like endonuclease
MRLDAELDMLGKVPPVSSGSTLIIHIPGVMRGKQRPRFSRQTGRAYTPEQTVNLEAHIKQCALAQVGQPRLVGALAVAMEIAVPVPASWPKRKRAEALSGMIRPTGKPDLDNCAKSLDALNEIVWRDDAQIVAMVVTKHYADAAGTVLRVRAA